MRCGMRQYRTGLAALLLAGVAFAGGCTLPYEQLTNPGPITGSIGDKSGGAPTGAAGPLSSAGSSATKGQRLYEGSGEFARPAGGASTGFIPPGTSKQSQPMSGAQSGSVSQDGITLNLANASVADAAKIVLGESLGVNYVVSERVKANITLRTVRPVDKAGLIEIFDTVLRSEGAALIAEGNLYKIIPANEAGSNGAPLQRSGARARQQIGVGTELVPLRFVSPTEMERILRSAAPQATILRVDAARNLLMISGTRTELTAMSELVSVFDVDWMRGMSFGILPVETADPDAIAQELDAIFANDRESPTKGIVRFVPNKRLKSILVISARPEYLRKAEVWLKRIDLASRATERQVNVYHVQHRPAGELAQLLQKVYFGRDGVRASGGSTGSRNPGQAALDGTTTARPDASGSAVPFAPPIIQPPPQPGFGPSVTEGNRAAEVNQRVGGDGATGDAGAASAADQVRSSIGGGTPPDDRTSGISIVSDEVNNSLVITATSSEFKRMRQILESIDLASNQVLLEATIAEVTLNDNLKFGLRWFLNKSNNSIKFSESGLDSIAPTAAAAVPALTGFSYFLNLTNLQVVLNALSSVTDVNVISSPTLMVQENKKAVLQVGDEVPIATQSAVGVGAAGAPIVNSISFRSTGVILGITPRVSDDGRVLLEIEQEVSGAVATSSSSIDSPTIQQRRVKTTVSTRDGQTIVLAGLMQDKSTRTRDQVPLLGNIPFIGNAFKNKTDTIVRTELLIAITPQVVRSSNQIDGITAEFRDKLNLSTRPQRQTPPDRREQIDRLVR